MIEVEIESQIDMAIEFGDLDSVKYLLEEGIKPTIYSLGIATINNHEDIVQFLHEIRAPYITWVSNPEKKYFLPVLIEKGKARLIKDPKELFIQNGGYLAIIDYEFNNKTKNITINVDYNKDKIKINLYGLEGERKWDCTNNIVKLNARYEHERITKIKKINHICGESCELLIHSV